MSIPVRIAHPMTFQFSQNSQFSQFYQFYQNSQITVNSIH